MRSSSIHTIGATAKVVDLCLTARDAALRPNSAIDLYNKALPPPIPTAMPDIVGVSGNRFGMIKFEFEITECVDQRLTPAQQNEFEIDFSHDLTRLEQWAGDRQWLATPVPEFHVVVSDRFKISRSLVPAWSGRAGHMEFPAFRVAARKAAIAHELVHVFFPNANRLLAEGLAIYLQAEIGGNPAFPNFGKPLHGLVRERLREMLPGFTQGDPASLDSIRLAELDTIATPNPLALRVGDVFYGEEPRGQGRIYPIAGSFIQFLIDTRGTEKFRALYLQTPLVPSVQNAGRPDRWEGVYGRTIAELETEWKALIAICS